MNVLIHFFLSSTCFEHLMFVTRKTLLYSTFSFIWYVCHGSLAGRRSIEHVIKPARLFAKMHDKRTI